MTVSNQDNRISVVGDGTTQAIWFAFPINTASDIDVYSRLIADGTQVELTETSDYTVSISGDIGGTVTMVTTFSSDYQIHIIRDTPNTQILDLEQGGAFNAENIEDAFDKNAKLTIENVDALERTLVFPATDPASSFADIPNSIDRANKNLTFDANGKPTASAEAETGSVVFSAIGISIAGAANAESERDILELGADDTVTHGTGIFDDIVTKGPVFSVTHPDFGAIGDGSTDDTAAIQAAIDAAESATNGGVVYLPPGSYKTTSTLFILSDRIYLRGAGKRASQIIFAPTANDTCLEIGQVGSVLTLGGMKDFEIRSTDEIYTKVAIDIIDVSRYYLESIIIHGQVTAGSGWRDTGNTSIGLRTNGRDSTTVKSMGITANYPIVISGNPNSSIALDHFHFMDLFLTASARPCVTIEDGVNLTNITFDGFQAWVKGTGGLYWADTTATGSSSSIVLRNIRREQEESSSGYMVEISRTQALFSLVLDNFRGSDPENGYLIKGVSQCTISNGAYASTTGEALNASLGGVVNMDLTLINNFWQTGSTASIVGLRTLFSIAHHTGPLPVIAQYQTATQPSGDTTVVGISAESYNIVGYENEIVFYENSVITS